MTLKTSDVRMRDPFILEYEPGKFVLYGTTDHNLWGGPATGFDCFTSEDLENWEGPIEAFRPPENWWGDTQFWAPEIHHYLGKYYLFATFASSAKSPKFRGVAILVAENPTGPFVPWSDGAITPAAIPCLDGTLFIDDEQIPWLVFSRGAEGEPGGAAGIADSEMLIMPISHDLRTAAGEAKVIFTASSASWSRPLWFPEGVEPPEQLNLAKDPLFTDGAFMVRTDAGELLMLWSSFGEEGYAMGVARSESGDLQGPWVQQDQPLWAKNGGHGMILRTSAGAAKMVFHWPNDTPNERVKLVDVVIEDKGIRLA